MKFAFLFSWLLGLFCTAHAAEWYETLRPGMTRSEILKLAGNPSESRDTLDTYKQKKGRIECGYGQEGLKSVIYYDTPDGAVSWTLYVTEGDLKQSDLEQRRSYLKAGHFMVMPKFSGNCSGLRVQREVLKG
jgi:hypothetical protein